MNKISVVNDTDPYTIRSLDSNMLPAIEATDLVNYLVLGTSAYTVDQFKAYRSLDAYNHFHSGWVKEVSGCIINNKHIVVGKVLMTDIVLTCLSVLVIFFLNIEHLVIYLVGLQRNPQRA